MTVDRQLAGHGPSMPAPTTPEVDIGQLTTAFSAGGPALAAGPAWIAIGLAVAGLVAWRGHELPSWTALGVLTGPLLGLWAVHVVARRERRVQPIEVSSGERGPGDLTVVVAVLGEPATVADSDSFVRSFGGRLHELVLVRPVSFEAARDPGHLARAREGRALSQAGLFVSGIEPRLVLVPGRGLRAAARFAACHRATTVVVVPGPRPPGGAPRPEVRPVRRDRGRGS